MKEFIKTLNAWGDQKIPFLFLVDFEMMHPLVFRLSDIDADELLYNCNGITNAGNGNVMRQNIGLTKLPMALSEYQKKFDQVLKRLEYGDSYLTNLTIKTPLNITSSLKEIFFSSKAKYKLLFRNNFLVFSPETFVQVRSDKIFSYPMKGTIDASVPGAKERILSDVKELAEHVTIVDLIRNDLSAVSENVKVTRFRYIDEIVTNEKKLLQVSSEIVGDLSSNYQSRLGDILVTLLPAGSISGAPKSKTVEIIRQAENEERGYYTGVFGIYDGQNLDSGVMIRFIEREGEHYYYRSGGGITTQSVAEKEYQEAIDKVYVPVN